MRLPRLGTLSPVSSVTRLFVLFTVYVLHNAVLLKLITKFRYDDGFFHTTFYYPLLRYQPIAGIAFQILFAWYILQIVCVLLQTLQRIADKGSSGEYGLRPAPPRIDPPDTGSSDEP